MGAPAEQRRLLRVIVRIVVDGHMDGQALGHVPLVLGIQRVLVVLRVAGDKDLPSVLGAHEEGPGHIALGQDAQRVAGIHIGPADAGVAAVGRIEHLIKTAHQRVCRAGDPVLEHAEHLFRQQLLVHTVVVVQARLGTPADVQGGVDVRLAEIHDLAQFRPVVHLLKVHGLHRGTGDDHAVVAVVLHLVKGLVECIQMGGRHMGGGVAGRLQQGHMHLQRRVGQQTGDLGLGGDLGGHQVQDQDLQRADVLCQCPLPVHDKDVFFIKGIVGGQGLGDDQRHSSYS